MAVPKCISGCMRPSRFLSFMGNIRRLLFSLPFGILVGLGTVAVLVVLIVREDSVQPYKNHKWAEDIISPPLLDGVEFTQVFGGSFGTRSTGISSGGILWKQAGQQCRFGRDYIRARRTLSESHR